MGICGKKEDDVFAEDAEEQEELRSRDIYKDLELSYLMELLLKAEKELQDFEDNPTNSMTYDDHRYPEEAKFESTFIMDRLEFRVQQIKKVIDDHLTAMHGRDQLGEFQGLTYPKKLEYLYKHANGLNA